MSDSWLEGEFATEVALTLAQAGVPFDLTLTKFVASTSPDCSEFDPCPPVPVNYDCRGFVDNYDTGYHAAGLVEVGDVKVVVVATSIEVVPEPGDQIAARGVTYSIISVEADPAVATYTLQART